MNIKDILNELSICSNHTKKKVLFVVFIVISSVVLSHLLSVSEVYKKKVLFTLKWGSEPGEIGLDTQSGGKLNTTIDKIYVDSKGYIYLLDYVKNERIQRFDQTGKLINIINYDKTDGFIPKYMGVGKGGNIYIWDSDKQMQVFDSENNFVKRIKLNKKFEGNGYAESGVLFSEFDGTAVSENCTEEITTARQNFLQWLEKQKQPDSIFIFGCNAIGWQFNFTELKNSADITIKDIFIRYADDNGNIVFLCEYLDEKTKKIKYKICKYNNNKPLVEIPCGSGDFIPGADPFTVDSQENIYEIVRYIYGVEVIKWEKK